ncbi:unnamed protein product [Pylaiella littoralis]
MLYALRTTSRTMKATNLEYFLLLVLCQYSAVLGFGLLPSSYRNVPLPCGCSSRTRALDHDLRHDRGVMMMAFWEDIVPGRGQKGTTKSSEASVDSKCPVLICPAQLSVPGDYKKMIEEFEKRGFEASCADLTRVGWIAGLLPSALSPEYFKGELTPAHTLKFYYEAIDRALEKIQERHPGRGVHIVGHSIGGWVARAWLAEGCSPTDRENMVSLTTLGTPNTGPPENAGGPWTAVDQTRGLLKSINTRFPGAHVEGVRYTSVAGTALEGELPGSLQEMLSYISYLPLCGDGGSRGDGIIPLDVATLEGSMVVELPTSKHSGFVPFPGKAIDLGPNFLWYGSPSLMGEWVGNLDVAEQERGRSKRRKSGANSGGWPW